MDLTPLRNAYESLLADAATHSFAEPREGGWNAGQVLAHVIINDREFASLCAQTAWQLTPTYDNRASQTESYINAVVRAAGTWPELIESLRRGSEELIALLETIDDERASYRFACTFIDGENEVTMEMSVAEFAGGLAAQHVPAHHQQLLALAAAPV